MIDLTLHHAQAKFHESMAQKIGNRVNLINDDTAHKLYRDHCYAKNLHLSVIHIYNLSLFSHKKGYGKWAENLAKDAVELDIELKGRAS